MDKFVVEPPPAHLRVPRNPSVRQIVALLFTSTWQPKGEIFPILEGRNQIGRDERCDVLVPDDDQMAGCHAVIFNRGDLFILKDECSLNGTLLEGQDVPPDGKLLANYSRIKTGATEWVFIMIDPSFKP